MIAFLQVPFQEGDMLQHIKDHSFKDLVHMINKPPRWNEQVSRVTFSGIFFSIII
jgi:hypothetical protein